MQAYLSELVSYAIKFVIMVAAAGIGAGIGIHLKKNKTEAK